VTPEYHFRDSFPVLGALARLSLDTWSLAATGDSSRHPVKLSIDLLLVFLLEKHTSSQKQGAAGSSALSCSRSASSIASFGLLVSLSIVSRSFVAFATAPSRQVRSVDRSFVDRFESKHHPARRQGPSSFVQAPIFVAQGPQGPFRSSRSSTSFGIASALASSSYVLVSSSAGSKTSKLARVRLYVRSQALVRSFKAVTSFSIDRSIVRPSSAVHRVSD
jgi:hypothetical protein